MANYNQSIFITSIDEAKSELVITDGGNTHLLLSILNRSRARIEAFFSRVVVTRATDLTEFHSPKFATSTLWTLDKPIISITTIHEDTTRAYGSTTLLTEGTDYIVQKPAGKIIRIASATGSPRSWQFGFRTVRVVGSFGYADTDSVPWEIKDPALRHVARTYREITREHHDLASIQDDVGRVQYFSDRTFNKSITDELLPYRRQSFGAETGERDVLVPNA